MNNTIFYFFYGLAHQSQMGDRLIVFFANYFPFVVLILAGLFLLFHHDVFKSPNPFEIIYQKKKEILKVFVTALAAWISASIIKILIHATRPFNLLPGVTPLLTDSSFSFPSGHATFFMALGVSIFLLHKKAGYWFISFAFLIGLARIVAGVHFPVDILGGLILGTLVAYLVKNV